MRLKNATPNHSTIIKCESQLGVCEHLYNYKWTSCIELKYENNFKLKYEVIRFDRIRWGNMFSSLIQPE